MRKVKIEEHEIAGLIREGKDKEVIPLLYKAVFPKVRSYIVSRKGVSDDASDAFQDALLYFYSQVIGKTYNEEKYRVYGYLFRLSLNRWINKIKKDKRITLMDDMQGQDFDLIPNEHFHAIELVSNDENLLRTLFSSLGEKCIEILNYTIYYNLMMEDIVTRMGLASEGAVKMQLKRCKEKLMKEVEDKPGLLDYLNGLR